jgi:hypothetical protein
MVPAAPCDRKTCQLEVTYLLARACEGHVFSTWHRVHPHHPANSVTTGCTAARDSAKVLVQRRRYTMRPPLTLRPDSGCAMAQQQSAAARPFTRFRTILFSQLRLSTRFADPRQRITIMCSSTSLYFVRCPRWPATTFPLSHYLGWNTTACAAAMVQETISITAATAILQTRIVFSGSPNYRAVPSPSGAASTSSSASRPPALRTHVSTSIASSRW